MDLEQRVKKITTVESADEQLTLATKYAKRLRAQSKNNKLSLSEKLALDERYKSASIVVRQLRAKIFDIEDAINSNESVLDLFPQLKAS